MTLQVELVVPEGEVWSGPAGIVIAKTLDGDIGVLTNHTPVLGILAEGSVVRILPKESPDGEGGDGDGGELTAAVGGGFFSVADNRVSILAHQAQLGREVDAAAARAASTGRCRTRKPHPKGTRSPRTSGTSGRCSEPPASPTTGPDEGQRGEGRGWQGGGSRSTPAGSSSPSWPSRWPAPPPSRPAGP